MKNLYTVINSAEDHLTNSKNQSYKKAFVYGVFYQTTRFSRAPVFPFSTRKTRNHCYSISRGIFFPFRCGKLKFFYHDRNVECWIIMKCKHAELKNNHSKNWILVNPLLHVFHHVIHHIINNKITMEFIADCQQLRISSIYYFYYIVVKTWKKLNLFCFDPCFLAFLLQIIFSSF